MSKPIHSYTIEISPEQIEKLRALLTTPDFEFVEKPYAVFSAKQEKLNVTVYEKGPKVLVQGRKTVGFVQNVLEPEVLGEARLGREEELDPAMFQPHFGVDESGKGDYFGPLVVAGVYTDTESTRALMDVGIMDSKRITSDKRIRALSDLIREIPGIHHEVLEIPPPRYNQLYDHFKNVNSLLAWGHATVIENLLAQRPDCPRALSDQFTDPRVLINALGEKSRAIKIDQRTKAESDVAVAAASILARESFINWMDNTGIRAEIPIPRGASEKVKEIGRKIVRKFGKEYLEKIGKTHFQTHSGILN